MGKGGGRREGESEYDTTRAAASGFVAVVSVLASVRACRSPAAVTRNASLLCLVVLANLPDEITESLVDVDPLLGRGLDELAAEVLGEVTALVHADLALILEITLVRHDDDRERVLVLDPEDLLVEDADFFEGVSGRDGVDQKEALASSHVLLPHGAIFLLASRVEDVEEGNLVVNDALLPVRILDGRVVLVDEVGLDELDSQSGLSNTSSTDHNQLVLPQELSPSGHCSDRYSENGAGRKEKMQGDVE